MGFAHSKALMEERKSKRVWIRSERLRPELTTSDSFILMVILLTASVALLSILRKPAPLSAWVLTALGSWGNKSQLHQSLRRTKRTFWAKWEKNKSLSWSFNTNQKEKTGTRLKRNLKYCKDAAYFLFLQKLSDIRILQEHWVSHYSLEIPVETRKLNFLLCKFKTNKKSLDKILNINIRPCSQTVRPFQSSSSPLQKVCRWRIFLSHLHFCHSCARKQVFTPQTVPLLQPQRVNVTKPNRKPEKSQRIFTPFYTFAAGRKNASHFYCNWCFGKNCDRIDLCSLHKYALRRWSVASNANKIISEP